MFSESSQEFTIEEKDIRVSLIDHHSLISNLGPLKEFRKLNLKTKIGSPVNFNKKIIEQN